MFDMLKELFAIACDSYFDSRLIFLKKALDKAIGLCYNNKAEKSIWVWRSW